MITVVLHYTLCLKLKEIMQLMRSFYSRNIYHLTDWALKRHPTKTFVMEGFNLKCERCYFSDTLNTHTQTHARGIR